jgi:hypothetical protein
MPTVDDVNRIVGRVKRFRAKLSERAGEGFAYVADVDGTQTKYTIENLKDLHQYEDELTSSFVWLWSVKDYYIALASARGLSCDFIYTRIRSCFAIQICADLANTLKHGSLEKKSWTKHHPRLKGPGFSAPQEAISELQYLYSGEIVLKIGKPDLVDIPTYVVDQDGVILGDALVFLSDGVDFWDALLAELSSASVGSN